ncbi:MAG: hypothetical protein LBR66_01930 [Candidatus Symbiothrix sp.]|jgi:hypothetical protein|nr:hypothetical protein [Candidatus Symbiothrix sp.]
MNIGYVIQTDPERVVSIAQGDALLKYVACHPVSPERAQSGIRVFLSLIH